MRTSELIARVQYWRHRLPTRVLLGVGVAIVAIAGLIWQHYSQQDSAEHTPPAASSTAPDAPAPGDFGDTTFEQLAPPTVTVDANSATDARAVVTRFATNFGTPNGNHDDWLARITPDVSVQLSEQYRLTDVRNITQAAVTAVDGPVRQEPASMTFNVTYDDGSRIEVRLETGPDGWKAVNVLPLTSNGLPAPSVDGQATPPAATAAPGTTEGAR